LINKELKNLNINLQDLDKELELLVDNYNINTIPEHVFIDFLDFFKSGGVKDDGTMAKWLNIAGGMTRCVKVKDKNDKIIFTVPALVSKLEVNYNANNTLDLNGIFTKAANRAVAQPIKFEKTVFDGTNVIVKNVNSNTNKELIVWRAIFKRYGIGREKRTIEEKNDSYINYSD